MGDANEHFLGVEGVADAEPIIGFRPRMPGYTAGRELESLQVFVRDYRMRDVPGDERVLEAHYGSFVLSQSRPGRSRARNLALRTSYGPTSEPTLVAGHEGRTYPLGPAVSDEDPDGRTPAVVTWYDDDRFYLIASTQLESAELVRVASSLYDP